LQVGTLYSQESFELVFSTGTELNIPSSSNPQNITNYHVLPGFNLSFRMQHNFESSYSLVGGIEYARMYWYHEGSFTIIPEDYSHHYIRIINQIRLPILFQVNFGKTKSRFYANTGIYLMVTFNDDQRTFGYDKAKNEWVVGAPKVVLPWNFGGALSVGYSYNLKPNMRLFAESRFLVPIFANPAYSTNFNTTRNLSIQVSVGLSFTTSPKTKTD